MRNDCERHNGPIQTAVTERHDFDAGLPKGVRNLVDHAATPIKVFSNDQSIEYYCSGNEDSLSVLKVNPPPLVRFVARF